MEEASEKEGKMWHTLSELLRVSVIAGLKAPSRRTAVPKASMRAGLQAPQGDHLLQMSKSLIINGLLLYKICMHSQITLNHISVT